MYRHGDRTPSGTFATNTVQESFWPNGYGQLTKLGQMQSIKLGSYVRKRYQNLLNSTYIANEIYIRSTDTDRTLMSAYCNLLGLYPTLEINESLTMEMPSMLVPWQPIPVHTLPRSIDHVS
ncbi:unnamed protein product [Didymodactylos carnosus]|uniref:acid phosphatase n=1 Tax=Didymodactylos carnosus TaxID=1234261 RepID=A0A8S2SL78_9BILA|nr:unnamed protein product [Didymodactylos carnosus]CAF4228079.1 unnamed protein product [Didymodactylos carnosus]